MPKYSLHSVLDWLRAGYPEGIPNKDQFALLAVLRRRLTDEELDQVVTMAVETAPEHPDRHVDYDHLRSLITGITHEEPSEKDIARVVEHLESGGWPVAGDDETETGAGTGTGVGTDDGEDEHRADRP